MRNEKLFLRVFNQIRAYIAQEHLKPGDMLPTEQELCEKFEVSRSVVRESTKAMEMMGLVRSTAGRGCQICEFNTEMLFECMLFFMGISNERAYQQCLLLRKNLELAYMKSAFYAMTPADIAEVRGTLNQCIFQWTRGHFFHADDMQFHMSIFKPLNDDILNSLLEAIWHVEELLHPEYALIMDTDRIEKHERIMQALCDRDYPQFAAAMQHHFSTDIYSNIEEESR